MTATEKAQSHPFRNVRYIDRPAAIHAQMVGAIEILKKWRWWRPVIAGGALWSWAAGNPANDIDIFARSTWWSRRRAKKMYGQSTLDLATVAPSINDGYGNMIQAGGLNVFRTTLSNHPTKVDFVLSKRGARLWQCVRGRGLDLRLRTRPSRLRPALVLNGRRKRLRGRSAQEAARQRSQGDLRPREDPDVALEQPRCRAEAHRGHGDIVQDLR